MSASSLKSAFVGIDVAFAKRKRLPIVVCVQETEGLVPLPLKLWGHKSPKGSGNVATLDQNILQQFGSKTLDYLHNIEKEYGLRIRRIAIDSPRASREEEQPRRACELALDGERISCFTTPSAEEFKAIAEKVRIHLARGGSESRLPHANQLWMLAGFALFESLSSHYECIEVYPHATVRTLGIDIAHKSNKKGLMAQVEGISALTGWPKTPKDLGNVCFGSGHDKLDAYLSAWVASLESDQREALGVPPHDVIWIPKRAVERRA